MAVCRQCSYDSSYLFVEAPANADMAQQRSRMVWVPFNAEYASTVGETISSVVQQHKDDDLYRNNIASGSCTLLAYCTDDQFSLNSISVFGAKISVGGQQMWYMGFRGRPISHVTLISVSKSPFVITHSRTQ